MEAIGARVLERRGQLAVGLDDGRRGRDVQAALGAMGLDVAGVATRLSAGETVAIEVPTELLPLAFGPAIWTQVVFEREIPLRGLFAEMLRDPRALLLWHGGLALDDSTRRFLEASPDLIRTLHRDAAPLFSAYAPAIAVRNARVQVGAAGHLTALWEQLVGESVARPAPFVRQLFTGDGGRLVMFFDLVQALPAAQHSFATGAWIAEPGQRLERFRALYAAVSRANAGWTPHHTAGPPARRPLDAAAWPGRRPGRRRQRVGRSSTAAILGTGLRARRSCRSGAGAARGRRGWRVRRRLARRARLQRRAVGARGALPAADGRSPRLPLAGGRRPARRADGGARAGRVSGAAAGARTARRPDTGAGDAGRPSGGADSGDRRPRRTRPGARRSARRRGARRSPAGDRRPRPRRRRQGALGADDRAAAAGRLRRRHRRVVRRPAAAAAAAPAARRSRRRRRRRPRPGRARCLAGSW